MRTTVVEGCGGLGMRCGSSEGARVPSRGSTRALATPSSGFWGRRLEAYFSVRGDTPYEEKSAHEHVRAMFVEMMDGRAHKIYSVDV